MSANPSLPKPVITKRLRIASQPVIRANTSFRKQKGSSDRNQELSDQNLTRPPLQKAPTIMDTRPSTVIDYNVSTLQMHPKLQSSVLGPEALKFITPKQH